MMPSSSSRRIERSQTIDNDDNAASKSPAREAAKAKKAAAQQRKKFSAAAIFSGISESAAANFMARHTATKKSSFSHIRFPSFSPQPPTKTGGHDCGGGPGPSASAQAPASARPSSKNSISGGGSCPHTADVQFRPKRFSFALNRKRWFSTSTSDPNSARSNSTAAIAAAAAECSRRTSTTEISSSTLTADFGSSSRSFEEASTSSTSQAYEDSAAAAGSSKRTSIRRFFTSNQKAESSGKNNHRHQHPNSSPAERPTSSSSASSALRTAEESGAASAHHHQLQPSTSVLSPSSQPTVPTTTQPSSSAQQNNSSSCTGPSTSASSALNNDIDLPPPMDQLGASGTSATGATAAGDEAGEGMAGTMMPVDEQQQNNTCNSGSTPVGGVEPSSSTTAPTTTGTTAGTPVEQMSPEESAKLKRSYVIQELVETERAYVVDLATIVDGYIGTLREMELPDEDREKVKIIFANIEQILDFHKSFFCKEIEKSLQDYEACGNAFIKYERRLHTFYVKYCQNKPKSDFLISQDNFEQLFSDIREKLGHKVALTDLLIKPVQRITKYQLMLNDILKYTHRAKDRADVLERAHDVMRVVPKACDDMMQVGRLQGFQGNLNAQGRLIHQGTLSISDGGTNQPFKGKDRRVFLFEQSVIIAECIPPRKEYGNPLYNFKNQIMVNKMQLLEEQVPDEPLRFVLQSNDPNQVATYVAQATSAEEKAQWLAKLSAQLDQQKTFLAALVDPKRYQSQLANSMGSVNISGKKDSSGSLGTPTSPAPPTGLGISPAKQQTTTAHGQQHKSSSSSKLFGFGKQKS